MTETRDPEQIDTAIDAVLARIDEELVGLLKRELVSSDEVSDLLLDVRGLLSPVQVTRVTDPVLG